MRGELEFLGTALSGVVRIAKSWGLTAMEVAVLLRVAADSVEREARGQEAWDEGVYDRAARAGVAAVRAEFADRADA